jgi:Fe-S cluster biogenesis protein NfuA
MSAVADAIVSQFSRMVQRDGGTLRLISEDGNVIRLGYKAGHDPECTDDGACVLPHVELQDMIEETLKRRAPDMKVVVQPEK